MKTDGKIVHKAADALRHVISAFFDFREENLELNHLLQNVEGIIENVSSFKREKLSDGAGTTVNNCHVQHTSCNCCVFKRKMEFGVTENDDERCKRARADNEGTNDNDDDDCHFYDASQDLESIGGDEEGINVEEQVFSIYLLHEKILRNLSSADLLTTRCIDSKWNSISTKLLVQRKAVKIKFTIDIVSDTYRLRLSTSTKPHKKDLKDLTKFLEGAGGKNFLCNDFDFSGGSINHEDLQKFLILHGRKIKNLGVQIKGPRKSDQPSPTVDDLVQLLLVQCPNLENLSVKTFPKIWNEKPYLCQIFPEPKLSDKGCGPLSKLKYFNFTCDIPILMLENILEVASNLEEVNWGSDYNVDIENEAVMPMLINLKLLRLLKEYHLHLYNDNLHHYEMFSKNCPPLRKLVINDYLDSSEFGQEFSTSLSRIISKIFANCADSLKFLDTCPLGFLSKLVVPVMSKLEVIMISNMRREEGDEYVYPDERDDDSFFPRALKFSKLFPVLKCFKSNFDFDYGYDYYSWEDTCDISTQDALLTLEKIQFCDGPPMSWINNFTVLFPNLTSLKIGKVLNVMEAMKSFCEFSHLKELEFVIVFDFETETNNYPAVDAAFTGFSKETCLHLYNTSKQVDVSTLKEIRVNKSILDLPKLQKLNLIIHDTSEDDRDEYSEPILSHVTGLFAFRMCPQLRVSIPLLGDELRMEKLRIAASPIFPYVHWYPKSVRCPVQLD